MQNTFENFTFNLGFSQTMSFLTHRKLFVILEMKTSRLLPFVSSVVQYSLLEHTGEGY